MKPQTTEIPIKEMGKVVKRFNMLMDVLNNLLEQGELSKYARKRIDDVIKARI